MSLIEYLHDDDGPRPAWWGTLDFGTYHARQCADRLLLADAIGRLEELAEDLRWLGQYETLGQLLAALGTREVVRR
ncbi:hypothetical protein [Nocardia pseudovaccinii]|uniref:hypothetical protein n=1 Tax=Nocardia pseudovaccinii TaxID=189540 RepID=UPI0007A4B6A3|nr:hypothetical protein [Nocardia pseudovaccinii]